MQLFLSRVAICRFIIRRLIAAVRLALNATLEKIKEKGCPAAAQRLERAQLTAAPRVRASGRPPIRAACGPGGLRRAQPAAGFFALQRELWAAAVWMIRRALGAFQRRFDRYLNRPRWKVMVFFVILYSFLREIRGQNERP